MAKTLKQMKADKVAKVMHESKEGMLYMGKTGKIVKDPKVAIAIALSEASKVKKSKKKK